MKRATLAIPAAALAAAASAAAFVPADPLAQQQWHLAATRAFEAWPAAPLLAPVRVAVIDSGVDRTHPELRGRIVAARSFVGGGADDEQGHGTIVAGLIAAAVDGAGVAGMSPSAELIVGKVVTADGTVPVGAEARAIRWAADSGAQVINISLGGLRDPASAERDTFSPAEADAVAYAVSKGALVVAAVGNGDQAPVSPWRYASYPAALPHVLGVAAATRSGDVPAFSNRDPVYVDVAAPGQDILSTFPVALTAANPACVEQGTTLCATDEYRNPEGTSFAAPQVSAAAALLFALEPSLRPEQVRTLLERSATDLWAGTGCARCVPGRDALGGWGRIDVAAAVTALQSGLPPADHLEPNDDAGRRARRLYGARPTVRAVVDFWDDQNDVFGIHMRKDDRLTAKLERKQGARAAIVLWRPGTESVDDLGRQDRRLASVSALATTSLVWRARETGWHAVQVKALEGGDPVAYTLRIRRTG